MHLLVLNFSQAPSVLKEILNSRSWKTTWLSEFDFNSVTSRLICGDIDQILIVEGEGQDKSDFILSLQTDFSSLPISLITARPGVALKHLGAVRVFSPPVCSFSLVHEIEKRFDPEALDSKKRHLQTIQQENFSLDPRFFTSIDLFHVIDRMFSYFSKRILCEDIHWVRHADLNGFLKKDLADLALELDVDYKKSHRLRSLNEQDPAQILTWIRTLPLNRFDHSETTVIQSNSHSHLWLPITDQGKQLGYMLFRSVESSDLQLQLEKMETAVQMMSRFVSFSIQMWETQSLTLVDDLTDLHNQRYLPRALDREISRAKRLQKKFTVLFLDIDYFKKVNDSSGHWIGSQILIELGQIFKESLRSCDYAFRYGGDEFVAILVDSDARSSQVVAERLRKKIEETPFEVEGRSFKVTVSIGLACYPDHAQTRQDIIEMADQAMYQGKNKSRNIVYVAS